MNWETAAVLLLAGFIGYVVRYIVENNERECNLRYRQGKYHGYLMGRNDAFYGDDRYEEVKEDAERK